MSNLLSDNDNATSSLCCNINNKGIATTTSKEFIHKMSYTATPAIHSSSTSTTSSSDCTKQCSTRVQRLFHVVTRKRIPLLGHTLDRMAQLPPTIQAIIVLVAVVWKFYCAFLVLRLLLNYGNTTTAITTTGRPGAPPPTATSFLSTLFSTTSDTAVASINHSKNVPSKPRLNSNNNNDNEIQSDTVDLLDTSSVKNTSNDDKQKQQQQEQQYHQQANKDEAAAVPLIDTAAAAAAVADVTDKPLRLLHIVTALAEYNNGSRGTLRGQDRLQEVMIPILVESVSSMLEYGYQVDVYLILGWDLKDERRLLIEEALPEGVGLQIWNDATPLGYDQRGDVILKPVTRGLARQHRFVIKDKLDYYDMFTVFEDDMRISGQHVAHFLEVSAELDALAQEAPDTLPAEPQSYNDNKFHGPLSKTQLRRMMPGFIRVEVLLDESKWPSQSKKDPIPIDFEFDVNDKKETRIFDPKPCCHVSNATSANLPQTPNHDQIMFWETRILGANVRKFPSSKSSKVLDWVLLQPGPKARDLKREQFVGGYWSGRNGLYFPEGTEKPSEAEAKYFAQQGGWMATREQLIEIHRNQCKMGYFPPFDEPAYKQDGLTLDNVEFWSGGFQLFSGGRAGCNMQRVISFHPDYFSKHFIYHTANNKQKGTQIARDRLVKVNDFYGQLNTVVKDAKKALQQEVSTM